ncbi:hypothetical protein E4631_11440 [Hymenobacter sp. UV11]|uniref:hypothetical protein n=1 Tax=Hymenobacter sp. UV11 TaxID=1849735 RepID=UPI0010601259|nr:hypothetical protein [Hymenobacter sp. UV11]TDN40381.1 hypothetical protein A8B98_13115 [Hymenobacter sp. UV11]TFZ66616.1 hypothetical protein E4631_11440 [Hymenobacter sp. UV11]
MTNRELRNSLLDLLASELSPSGFVLNKAQAGFTNRLKDGWKKFHLIFLVRSEGWEINPGVLVRKNVVEDLYHKASYFEAKYHKTTPTIGIALENLNNDGNSYRLTLTSERDVLPCYHRLLYLFNNVAIPFFEKYSSLEELDKEVNIETRKSIFSGLNYEGNLGIILAKLVNNPHYHKLEEKYRNYYQQFSNGFYLPEYEGIVEVLKSV